MCNCPQEVHSKFTQWGQMALIQSLNHKNDNFQVDVLVASPRFFMSDVGHVVVSLSPAWEEICQRNYSHRSHKFLRVTFASGWQNFDLWLLFYWFLSQTLADISWTVHIENSAKQWFTLLFKFKNKLSHYYDSRNIYNLLLSFDGTEIKRRVRPHTHFDPIVQ